MRKWLVLTAGVLILMAVNVSVYQREQLLKNGKVVLLELAPVDPRSLMQGDYMALQYQIANQAFRMNNLNADTEHNKKFPQDGYVIAELNEHAVATFKRFANQNDVMSNQEVKLRYRMRNGSPKFATNAFFFQEGTAEKYQQARYGEFRVADNGDMILTKMRDKDLLELNNNKTK